MNRRRWLLVIGFAGLPRIVCGALPPVGQESGEAGLAVLELRGRLPLWARVANKVHRWLGW